jgi:hypothetical protein
MNRRRFLQVGLLGAGALALGGVGLGLRPSTLRAPARPLQALDPVTFSVIAAVADRVVPGGGAWPTASQVQVAEKIDALLATCEPGMVAEVRQALQLLENALAGLLLDGRTTTFTGSGPEAQDAILEAWRTSGLLVQRTVYKAVRGLCASAYFASPEVWPAMGYGGPPNLRLVAASEPGAAAPSEATP